MLICRSKYLILDLIITEIEVYWRSWIIENGNVNVSEKEDAIFANINMRKDLYSICVAFIAMTNDPCRQV